MFSMQEPPSSSSESEVLEVNSSYQYEDHDINRILEITIQSDGIKFARVEVLGAIDNIINPTQLQECLKEAKIKYTNRILLIPYNIGNYHWIGLVLELDKHGIAMRMIVFKITSSLCNTTWNCIS